jgi:ABC-2 type transport system permease protein
MESSLNLLPLSFAPGWLRAIASSNPLAYAVDAARAVFNAHMTDPSVARGVAIMAMLAILAVGLAARQSGRAIA